MAGQDLGSIEAPASMENWDRMNDFVSELITESIGDKARSYKLRLASEELISNIIRAAGEVKDSEKREVWLRIAARIEEQDGRLWFVVETKDNGRQYDPQFGSRKPVDTEQHINEREIGGLGLFLIEQSVDRVSYDWIEGCNTYRLWLETLADAKQV